LSNVVSALNLNVEWGKKYGDGNPLKTLETIKLLRCRMNLESVRNTKLVKIGFSSENPNEAARIPNTIAEAYKKYRDAMQEKTTLGGILVLTNQYQEEEEQIRTIQTNVDLLREKFKINKDDEFDFDHLNITLSRPTLSPEERDKRQKEFERTKPFWDEKRKLNNLTDFHKLLAARIEFEKANLEKSKVSYVEIVDAAKPPEFPAGPNRWLGAALLVVGLFSTVGGFLLLKSSLRSARL
jgi:uncharacterized protein involved in exopolysaccharide biosynthesis